MPKVSVIIPVYNAAKYLRETANSEIGRPAGTDTPCSLSGLSDSELYALIARTEAEP